MSLTAEDLAVIQAMIDAAAPAGEGFAVPIVAGQQLLIPGIESPNFSIAGQSGWAILQNGLAYFYAVTLSGGTITGPDYIINPAGIFIYSGPPAAGNLIVSIAPAAGVDGFTNPYPQGINVTIGTISGAAISGSTFSGTDFLVNAAGAFFYSGAPGLGNLVLALAEAAGTDAFTNPFPQGLMAAQVTLVNQAAGPPSFAGASVLYSSTQGRPRYKSSAGSDNVIQRADVNVSQFTVGNTTVAAVISAPVNYQALEAAQGSEYEIEIDGNITTTPAGTADVLTFGLYVDGAALGAAFSVGASFLAKNLTFSYALRFRLTVLTAGAGGTCNTVADGAIAETGVNFGNTNTAFPIGSLGTGKAFDSTSAHTIQAYASWANSATGAGQSLTTYRTRVTRRF